MIDDNLVCRRIDILGGHVTDPDWPRRNRDRLGLDRDRSIDGTLEETRGHSGETETTPTTQHRDFRWQRRRGRRKSWSHSYHCLDQSSHRWATIILSVTLCTPLFIWTLCRTVLLFLCHEIYRWIRAEKDTYLFLFFCFFFFFLFLHFLRSRSMTSSRNDLPSHLANFYSDWWKCSV